jgi:hypothetical protein
VVNLYQTIYQFWSSLFFNAPLLDSGFYHALTTISIFSLLISIFLVVWWLFKVITGGKSKWF